MKKILLLLVLIIVFSCCYAHAYKVEQFMFDYMNASEKGEREFLMTYLQGITSGTRATNILSYHENKRHIYCPPQNVSIDGKRVMLLLPNFLVEAEKGNTKFNKFSGNTPLSAAVPILLIHTYPCS